MHINTKASTFTATQEMADTIQKYNIMPIQTGVSDIAGLPSDVFTVSLFNVSLV